MLPYSGISVQFFLFIHLACSFQSLHTAAVVQPLVELRVLDERWWLMQVCTQVVGSIEWGVGEDLSLDLIADGLGHLLDGGLTVDHLLNMAPLQRMRLAHFLWIVDTMLSSHLMTSMLDSGDGGGMGSSHNSGSNGAGMMEEERVSFWVSLTLGEDNIAKASRTVLGDNILADNLNLDVVVVHFSGDTFVLEARNADLSLNVLMLNAAVGGQDGCNGGNPTSKQQLRVSLWLGCGKGHRGHGSSSKQLEHGEGLEDDFRITTHDTTSS